jgi:hypothetical protein
MQAARRHTDESGDYGTGIAVDAGGAAFLGGYTSSANFTTTTGAYQTTLSGATAAFIGKVAGSGSALVWQTLIGAGTTQGQALTVDAGNNPFLAVTTTASTYPTTAGAYQTTSSGGIAVTKFNSASGLVWSTFVGSNGSVADLAAVPVRHNPCDLTANLIPCAHTPSCRPPSSTTPSSRAPLPPGMSTRRGR